MNEIRQDNHNREDYQKLIETIEGIIDKNREELLELGRDLFAHPELGFKEFYTRDQAVAFLERWGIPVETGLSVTGFRATLGEGNGPHIGLIGELDAIPTPGHPFASPDLSAAHACGHNNQMVIGLGAMIALKQSGVLTGTGARVTFIATPAEEFTDFEFRRELVGRGVIRHMSGKQDMVRNGVFDDIDLVIACHSLGGIPERVAEVNGSLNGFLSKRVEITGRAAHAGAHPHLGINALSAANIGLVAVNAQRETFRELDCVRVHGIITEGGQTVNTVPERVVLEYYVRAATVQAITDTSIKVDRSFEGGAHAMGAAVTISDTPGYLPLVPARGLSDVLKDHLVRHLGADQVQEGQHSFASGDIGDLSMLMPAAQFGFGGFTGTIHGKDFAIVDEDMAYLIPAKALASSLADLVRDQAALARQIIQDNPPRMTKEDYLKNWLRVGQ